MSALGRFALCWLLFCVVPTVLSVWLKPDTVYAYLTGLFFAGAVFMFIEIGR